MRLVGKRVVLRKLRDSDANDLFLGVMSEGVREWTIIPSKYSMEMAFDFIKKTRSDFKNKGVELLSEGKIIGMISTGSLNKGSVKCSIGYWVNSNYRGKGYASEALKLLLDFCFNELKIVRVSANVFVDNKASAGLLEKNGFVKEGLLRKNTFKEGKFYDEVVYAIVK